MRDWRRVQVTGALGVCVMGAPLLQLLWNRTPVAPSLPTDRAAPTPRSAADRTLREARTWRVRAQFSVNQKRDVLEAWDPRGTAGLEPEEWRRQLMASDGSGDLRRARMAALRGAALARTPDEAYRAAALLARIECDAGHHDAELWQARRLMALAPRNPLSLMWLRHAAQCNGLEPLAQWAWRALLAQWNAQDTCRSGPHEQSLLPGDSLQIQARVGGASLE